METEVLKAISEAKSEAKKVLLILDGIDFLLAATECRVDEILDTVWELREVCLKPLHRWYGGPKTKEMLNIVYSKPIQRLFPCQPTIP